MYIGVDIGGSKILVAASEGGPKILHSQKIKTPKDGNQGVAEIIHLIEQVAAKAPVRSIAIAAPGPFDRKAGVYGSVVANLPGWANTKLTKPLQNHFNLPVSLHQDVEAAGIAEATIGAGRDQPYVLYVTISTGIGASLVVNGETYHGTHNLEAGHIIIDPDGPVCGCGGRGHFEALVSGPAIKKRYGKYGYEITDPAVWDEIAGTMALGFHSFIAAYSPSIVVVGGGVGVHYDQFHDFLVAHLQRLNPLYPLPPIVVAKHTETAVAYGALIFASRHI
ncbi:MAG TPA: ROK family protein [Candidatus Saccharimonadales bacterium]|nr:ROK family protein [Candidatus Saccharimonadales bacterium]